MDMYEIICFLNGAFNLTTSPGLFARPSEFKSKFTSMLFLGSFIALIVGTLLNRTDITDSWILAGILPYFFIFTLTYSLAVGYAKRLSPVAVFTAIFSVMIASIPNLKYSFIYGYHDPLYHYAFIRETVASGHVSTVGVYATQYGAAPGMHIVVSILSILTGFDVAVAMKVFLSICPAIIPVCVYFIVRRLSISTELGKTIIASAIVATPEIYAYFGTSAIYAMYFLFIYLLLILIVSKRNSPSEFVLITILGFAIVISHDITTFHLLAFVIFSLLIIAFGSNSKMAQSLRKLSVFFLLFIVMVFAHYLFTVSIGNFSQILDLIAAFFSRLLEGENPAVINYAGFFQLGLFDRATLLFLRYGQLGLLFILTVLSLIAYYKSKKTLSSDAKNFYSILRLPLVIFGTILAALLFIRPATYRTFYVFSLLPFLIGSSIFFFARSKRFTKIIFTIVLSILILLTMSNIYPYQPLAPTISKSSQYYALDMRQVNSIYAQSVISFTALNDLNIRFWTDNICQNQINAWTNSSFQNLLSYSREKSPMAIIFLTGSARSVPSGYDAEQNDQKVFASLHEDTVLFTNGKSFLVLNASIVG